MVIIRTERPEDREAVRSVTAAAFRDAERHAPSPEPGGEPGEAVLVGWLREDDGWIPGLSLVAVDDGLVLGHVVATRASVGEPAYYSRFGFAPAMSIGVIGPDPSWGDYFQVRTLTAYDGHTGHFRYAEPFDWL